MTELKNCLATDALTPAHRQEVDADGVTVVRGLLTAAGVEQLRAVVAEELGPEPGDQQDRPRRRFHNDGYLWRRHGNVRRFCLDSSLPAAAAYLLGVTGVRLLMDEVFVKEPDTDVPVPWHNDASYWPVGDAVMGSFWFALDDVSADNGAVVFRPGSHRRGRLHAPTSFLTAEGPLQGDDEAALRSWSLRPGDALFFTALTEHHSPGNRSSAARRRAYTVRFAGHDVRYRPRPGTSPLMQVPDLADGAELPDTLYPLAAADAVSFA